MAHVHPRFWEQLLCDTCGVSGFQRFPTHPPRTGHLLSVGERAWFPSALPSGMGWNVLSFSEMELHASSSCVFLKWASHLILFPFLWTSSRPSVWKSRWSLFSFAVVRGSVLFWFRSSKISEDGEENERDGCKERKTAGCKRTSESLSLRLFWL